MRTLLFDRVRWIAASLLAVLVGIGSAAPATAQDGAITSAEHIRAMTPVAWQNLGIELTLALDADQAQARQESMQLVNFFATHYRDRIDLTRAVPRLLRIYENDAEENARILALTALHAIGEESSMTYLRELVRTEQSPRVRRLTLAVLSEYDRRAL